MPADKLTSLAALIVDTSVGVVAVNAEEVHVYFGALVPDSLTSIEPVASPLHNTSSLSSKSTTISSYSVTLTLATAPQPFASFILTRYVPAAFPVKSYSAENLPSAGALSATFT